MRLRCRLGLHGADAGRSGKTPADTLAWCVECGTTWQENYDMAYGSIYWTKRRDLSFGTAPTEGSSE